jgi:hypothetical protein
MNQFSLELIGYSVNRLPLLVTYLIHFGIVDAMAAETWSNE